MNKMFFAGVALTLALVTMLSIFGFASEDFNSGIDSNAALEGSVTENSFVVIDDKDEVVNTPQSSSSSGSSKSRNSDNGIINRVVPVNLGLNVSSNITAFIDVGYDKTWLGTDLPIYLELQSDVAIENDEAIRIELSGIGTGSGNPLVQTCSFMHGDSSTSCPELSVLSTVSEQDGTVSIITLMLSTNNYNAGVYGLEMSVQKTGEIVADKANPIKFLLLDPNKKGDVNGDGVADVIDVEIVRYLIGRAETGRADVDGDKMVNFNDITEILANWGY
ncbi:MAG: dockerin type I repeat-containing protein [Nanoarchaeota archaeon]